MRLVRLNRYAAGINSVYELAFLWLTHLLVAASACARASARNVQAPPVRVEYCLWRVEYCLWRVGGGVLGMFRHPLYV